MTDLAHYIQSTPLMDTHEHLRSEDEYVNQGPDVLADLFANYVGHDLISAGADSDAMWRAVNNTGEFDVATRWAGIKDIWPRCRYTGYGQVVEYIARTVYGMDEITLDAIEAASTINVQRRQPGERLRILREEANLDHVQIDDFTWACEPDPSGPEFFLYDLSWEGFSSGQVDVEAIRTKTGVSVTDLASLRDAMSALFARYAGSAIAVKTQHAYTRALSWQERDDTEAGPVLDKLRGGAELTEAERLCLGDWGLARGVELAIQHHLPVKIHTGYLAANDGLIHAHRIGPANLCPLIQRYPAARFVLMHTGYPYTEELIAMAKHYPNIYADMCWAWSINPRTAAEFVRRFLHAVPLNKLFVFGGDIFWPTASMAYAAQVRAGLTRVLQAEIDDGFLTESQAITLADRLMRGNQRDVFDLDGTRATIRAAIRAEMEA